jgi:hypothetical protein
LTVTRISALLAGVIVTRSTAPWKMATTIRLAPLLR